MPCSDGGVPYPPTREEILNDQVPTAMLCALLAATPVQQLTEIMGHIDWKSAGITNNDFMEWWRNHKRRDAEREAATMDAKHRDRLRKQARKKLTEAEAKALGLAFDDLEDM